MRILVVEDDAPLAGFVRKGLEAEHYTVDVAGDGELARSLAEEYEYDLLVLDLNLPKLDGISLLSALRPAKPDLPVLVLTARSRIEDRVMALDSGADDYLIKPFSFSELSARVRALLRRGRAYSGSVLKVADLMLDRVERKVERAGKHIDLTSKEFALLEYLMRNAGRRVTRTMIIEHVWNLSFDTATNIVDVYINYLFAGTATRTQPFREDPASLSGVSYEGNHGVAKSNVTESHAVQLNIPGGELFMSPPGSGVFHSLNELIAALDTGDTEVIGDATSALRGAFDHITSKRVFYGNAIQQLESDEASLASLKVQLSSQENEIAGANQAESITRFLNADTARQTALKAAGSISRLSLLDFLR